MEEFRVPLRTIAVAIRLEDGEVLSGGIPVAESSPTGHEGTAVDRLNDADPFLPLSGPDGSVLLHKGAIVWVELALDAEDGSAEDGSTAVPVELNLVGGETRSGEVRYVMPPERSRLMDFLNRSDPFVEVTQGRRRTLVHRKFVIKVREQNRF